MNEKIDLPGIVVEEYGFDTYTLGAPGVQIMSAVVTKGSLKEVHKKPESFSFIIQYDCPFLFPISDRFKTELKFQENSYHALHLIRKRGQQAFSTLDTNSNPYFSTLQIRGFFPKEIFDLRKEFQSTAKVADFAWTLITHLNSKVNDTISDKDKIDLEKNIILSYRIYYVRNSDLKNPFAKTVVPYTPLIDLKGPNNLKYIDEELLRLYLNEKIEIVNYFERNFPDNYSSDFSSNIFHLIHDFAFYANERTEALSKLTEELIRDLLLLIIKSSGFPGEAEVFNYDGKLDFKITNPKDKYDIISGELKFWSDKNSFAECFEQLTIKHYSGNETEGYLIFLSRNKNIAKTYEGIITLLKDRDEYVNEIDSNVAKSKSLFFSKHLLNINGNEFPVILGMINVYYEKI